MKLKISYRLRQKISKKYLDWSETLPRFGGGPIAALQRIREHQRSEAKNAQDRTQPPEGTEIVFVSFRLFEMYQIEEFGQFQESLLRFLPELSEPMHKRIYTGLDEFPRGDSIKWQNIGIISREAILTGGFQHSEPNLPNEISFIELGMYRILPSIFVSTFDVHLTEEAGKKLSRIQSRYYLPKITLFELLPRVKHNFISHSFTDAEFVKTQEINCWIAELQFQVEDYLQPLLKGFFSSQQRGKRVSLPIMEVYALRGAPLDREEFVNWENESHGWYKSFGFNSFGNRYKSNKYIFELPPTYKIRETHKMPEARLIARWEPLLHDENLVLQRDFCHRPLSSFNVRLRCDK